MGLLFLSKWFILFRHMKAIIFAAGEGTRLRPLTYEVPKPLLLVNDRPIIFRLINSLPSEVDEVFIVVDYLADKIIKQFKEREFLPMINFVTMDISKERGTWSALWQVKNIINDNEKFLVLNGDDLIEKTDLEKVVLENDWVIGYQKKNKPGEKYRNILLGENGEIIGMPLAQPNDLMINVATGTYLLTKDVFALKPIKTASGEWGLPQTIEQEIGKRPIKGVEITSWQQINTIADLERVSQSLKSLENH